MAYRPFTPSSVTFVELAAKTPDRNARGAGYGRSDAPASREASLPGPAYRDRGRRFPVRDGRPGGIHAGQAVNAAHAATLHGHLRGRSRPVRHGPVREHRRLRSRPGQLLRAEGHLVEM